MNSADTFRAVERAVAEVTDIQVSLVPRGEEVLVTGHVSSNEQRDEIMDIVTSLLPDTRVEDELVLVLMNVDVPASVDDQAFLVTQSPAEPESDDPTEEAIFPPTDPVVRLGGSGQLEVLGGFSETSLDDVEADLSATGDQPGDLALEEAVRRELREDAATTDLQIEVTVARGVVYLTGRVAGPEDADAAESVAASVPGVTDVVDRLEVGA
jgi:osmotically-inducible protein OsmY